MGASAAATAGATAGATGGGGIAGGILTAGAGALATKAVADSPRCDCHRGRRRRRHTTSHHHHLHSGAYARVAGAPTGPVVVAVRPSP